MTRRFVRKFSTRTSAFVLLVASVLLPRIVQSQTPDSPSIGLFGGAGIQHDAVTHGAFQAGASYEQYVPNHWFGYMFEGGYVGPFSNLHGGSALFSLDYMSAWSSGQTARLYPFATAGYSYLFGTGHAVNFGPGIDIHLKPSLAIRVEARDYFVVSSPHQHNFAIRIGIRRFVWD